MIGYAMATREAPLDLPPLNALLELGDCHATWV
jgi:hypothetical protein